MMLGVLALVESVLHGDVCETEVVSMLPEGAQAQAVWHGDMNGDGLTDLVVASAGDNTIAWFERLSNGSFARWVVDSDAVTTESVVVADMNLDGEMDLVVAARGAESFYWYKNLGKGLSFERLIVSDQAKGARCVSVADIDGDGFPDIVGGSTGDNHLQFYLNPIPEGFEEQWKWRLLSAGERKARAVWAGDLDGDGHIDVVAASDGLHRVDVFWHVDTYPVIVETHLGDDGIHSLPRSVYAADVDGDSTLDVIVADADQDTISVFHLVDEDRRQLLLEQNNMTTTLGPTPLVLNVSSSPSPSDTPIPTTFAPTTRAPTTFFPTTAPPSLSPSPAPVKSSSPTGFARKFDKVLVDEGANSANYVHAIDVDGDGTFEIFGALGDSVAAYERQRNSTYIRRTLYTGPENIQSLVAFNANGSDSTFGDYFIGFASKNDDQVFMTNCWPRTKPPTPATPAPSAQPYPTPLPYAKPSTLPLTPPPSFFTTTTAPTVRVPTSDPTPAPTTFAEKNEMSRAASSESSSTDAAGLLWLWILLPILVVFCSVLLWCCGYCPCVPRVAGKRSDKEYHIELQSAHLVAQDEEQKAGGLDDDDHQQSGYTANFAYDDDDDDEGLHLQGVPLEETAINSTVNYL